MLGFHYHRNLSYLRRYHVNVGLILIATIFIFFIGYRFYGGWIAKRYGVDPEIPTPAHTHHDNVDYAPARPLMLFGHHFASIAAAGPIVGPTLALLYGMGPTWLWIVGGVLFFGAVHDFSSLFISLREDGKSVAEIARRVLGRTGFFFFLGFAFLLCILVSAAFVDLTARALTSRYPVKELGIEQGSTFLRVEGSEVLLGGVASSSVVIITLFSPLLGWLVYRRNIRTVVAVVLAAFIALLSVFFGFLFPVQLNPNLWIAIILAYCLLAAYIPVWVILQPRDFTNVQFLYLGLSAMIVGITVMGLKGVPIQAPILNITKDSVHSLGEVWPFLFVTIACGAVSGAHALICSGTTSKQIDNEKHALFVGYGGMLMESLLALCVVLSVSAGLGFDKYLQVAWPSIVNSNGDANPPLAFALGVGYTLLKGLNVPLVYGTIFGILILEGFLITTIDTVIRLSRYLLDEFWHVAFVKPPTFLRSRLVNSVIPIVLTALLAYGHGYRAIWPLFGSANQLLAALTLVVATVWLARKSLSYWFVAFPAAFMAVTTIGALVFISVRNIQHHQWLLVTFTFLLLGLAVGFVLHSSRILFTWKRNVPLSSAEPS